MCQDIPRRKSLARTSPKENLDCREFVPLGHISSAWFMNHSIPPLAPDTLTFPPGALGEKLATYLVEPRKGVKWPKKVPRVKTRRQAIDICRNLCQESFIVRADKLGKGELKVRFVESLTDTCSIDACS
jgi:hypothetical protein